ncbi:MAG TPA: hypothetical protein DCW90_14620 [Lachnospiraceae bacterium]|nr:hypothetical protein [Lachnospiraceae bacterium]
MNDRYDVIVIGGGFAGLMSSCILSKNGQKVLLIEKQKSVGGMSQMIHFHGEEYFMGAHHIAGICKNSQVGDLFESLGLPLEEYFEEVKIMHIIIKDKIYDVPLKLDELERYVEEQFPEEKNSKVFFEKLAKYKEHFILGNDKGLLEMFMETSSISYLDFLRKYFTDTTLMELLTMLGPGYGGVGINSSAFNNLSLLVSYGIGSGYIKGSNTVLLDKFLDIIKKNGSEVHTSCECVDLIVENEKVTGVVCEENSQRKIYRCHNVLFASYPFSILKPYIEQKRLYQKISKFNYGPSVVRLVGTLDENSPYKQGDFAYMGNNSYDCLEKSLFFKNDIEELPVCMLYFRNNGETNTTKFMFTFLIKGRDIILKDKVLLLIKQALPTLYNSIQDSYVIQGSAYKAITCAEYGSVFGWERSTYAIMNTNSFSPQITPIEGCYIAGNWSTDFGIYGAVRTANKASNAILSNTEKEKR